MRTTRANGSVRTNQCREWLPLLRGDACEGALLGGADRAGGADRITGADMPAGGPIDRGGADMRGDGGAPESPGPEYDGLDRGTA
jgi:hypothetical protein